MVGEWVKRGHDLRFAMVHVGFDCVQLLLTLQSSVSTELRSVMICFFFSTAGGRLDQCSQKS